MFKVEVVLTYWVLERAIYFATEYCRIDAVSMPLHALESWDSHAALAAMLRVLFIYRESSSSGFVEVNFDGSVRDATGGAGYVI